MPINPSVVPRLTSLVAPVGLVAAGAVLAQALRPSPAVVVVPAPAVAVTSPAPAAEPAKAAPSAALIDRVELLPPIVLGNLAVTPIVLRDMPGPEPDLSVLDEAMTRGDLVVTETGTVSTLRFANSSSHPVLVLAGEVILGGRQDRIVGSSTVVPPHADRELPVYCVEHGRWAGTVPGFTSAHAIAHERLRARASFHDQSDVWAEVSSANSAHGIANATGTYRDLVARQADGTFDSARAAIEQHLAALPAGQHARLVGFAESVAGTLLDVEVFATPGLLARLQPKLLDAFLADAADGPRTPAAAPSETAIRAFVSASRRDGLARTYETDAARTETWHGDHAGMVGVASPDLGDVEISVNAD